MTERASMADYVVLKGPRLMSSIDVNIHVVSKKQYTRLLIITSANVHRF